MGMPKTWCEELIAEWLQTDGYLVETNVPVGTGRGGGRKEADVIGVRASRDAAEIVHIEVGQIPGSKRKSAEMIGRKFEERRIDAVLARYRDLLGIKVNREHYRKIFVASWASPGVLRGLKEELGKEGVEVLHLKELFHRIIRHVRDRVMTDKGVRTLPESLWLLKMIEFLVINKLLPHDLLE